MSKAVAENVKQLSVRIDDAERERIDAMREMAFERTGLRPQRSEVIRQCLRLGVVQLADEQEMDLTKIEKRIQIALEAKKKERALTVRAPKKKKSEAAATVAASRRKSRAA